MRLVEIRMLDSGPNGNYPPGEVVAIDEARAALLVETGHATYELEDGPPTPENAPVKKRKAGDVRPPQERGGAD